MNKRERFLSVSLATMSCLGIASVSWLAPSAIASQQPECYMIDESGQLIDLSSLCNSSSQTEQAVTERSILEETTSVEQPISDPNYAISAPLVDSNLLPRGFANSVPIAYEGFSNVVYTSPRFWVRSFQETAGSRSASFTELPTLINLLQQGKPLIFIERHE